MSRHEAEQSASHDEGDAKPRRAGEDLRGKLSSPSTATLLWTLVGTLVVMAGGAASVLAGEATYQSRALVVIDEPRGLAESTDAGIIEKLAQLRFKYLPLVRTDPVVERAAAASGLEANVIRSGASAAAERFTLAFTTIGTSDDRGEAREIAQATAEGLVRYAADEQEANGIPPRDRFFFEIVSAASPAVKTDPTAERVAAVAITSGLIVGLALYVALSLREVRSRSRAP